MKIIEEIKVRFLRVRSKLKSNTAFFDKNATLALVIMVIAFLAIGIYYIIDKLILVYFQ